LKLRFLSGLRQLKVKVNNMTMEKRAKRLILISEFELDLLKLYEKYSTLLTEEETNAAVQRFMHATTNTGR